VVLIGLTLQWNAPAAELYHTTVHLNIAAPTHRDDSMTPARRHPSRCRYNPAG
jgi:hypothetical protein